MRVTFPNVFAIDELRADNPTRQIVLRTITQEGTLATFRRGKVRGFLFRSSDNQETLILPKRDPVPDGHQRAVHAQLDAAAEVVDLRDGVWLKHPSINSSAVNQRGEKITEILRSWQGAFSFVQENPDANVIGLRPPQLGAVHAVHAHWSVSNTPGTIVMPTGTGKTETMLCILVSVPCNKLFVVVPTDVLRTQIVDKFLTLGLLMDPRCRALNHGALFPIVCALRHIPRTVAEVDDIFGNAQVVVSTSSIAGQCEPSIQDRVAHHCRYLFIDEAHHAEAPTWSAFKEKFAGGRILQFTATPFREDGKPLDGAIIYKYPLKQAQEEGYFKPIQFEPVVEFDPKRSDEAIASRAMEQLRADWDRGHILMARVDSVKRAADVYPLYSRYPEFKAVQLHTGIKSLRVREKNRQALISGESRVVVCVDMLGEGFDLPELKIAAFHDIRKTLAVTLQLAGRFTRSRSDLGNATFIANTAEISVRHELRNLYTRDPDWNILLPQLSEKVIGEQQSLQDFVKGFAEFTKDIPLKTVRPATSAVVYRTTCGAWSPDKFREGIPGLSGCEQVYETINHAEHTLVVVTARRVPLAWTEVESLFAWEWELYVVIWFPDTNLLFINSSTNSGEYKALAQAVAGENVALIKGQQVFRTFAGVHRLQLQNVGLTEQLGRNVRYTGRMGSDVEAGITEAQRRRGVKSVLSGSGFEDGVRVTVGASRKGRIWSQRRERVDKLKAWCKKVGHKLLDENIDPEEILKGTLEARALLARPARMPIGIDWPEEIYTSSETTWLATIAGQDFSVGELSLEIVSASVEGPLQFAIVAETSRAEFRLELYGTEENPNYRFVAAAEVEVTIRRGHRADSRSLTDFFYENAPVIWFADGSSLEGNQYVELKEVIHPYNPLKLEAWDWVGIDIRKESQGPEKQADSIQAAVIRRLRERAYGVIVDDDGKGEAADIVTIRVVGEVDSPNRIEVEFYHCKYSGSEAPGQRIGDLYEVCGQAQKSIHWMSSPEKSTELFVHLLRREAQRRHAHGTSRIEIGSTEVLQTIHDMSQICPISLKIWIVQPGVSKANVTRDQLQLMSVTENYLRETYELDFGVITSE